MRALHPQPSISKSGLLLSPCIAWAGPQAQWYDESKIDPADKTKQSDGTLFHQEIDAFTKDPDDVRGIFLPRDVPKWLGHATKYLSEELIPRCSQISTEVAIAINWLSGEVKLLPDVKDRGYPDWPGWQFGTADIVAILWDGSLYVADWKTGGIEGAEEQLLSLAYGFQKSYAPAGSLPYRLGKVIISCLQVNENGVWPHEREVSDQELLNHKDAMAFTWEDIGKKYDPKPGVHCTALFCPHLAYCTSISDVVGQAATGPASAGQPRLIGAGDLLKKLTDNPKTDAEAGDNMALVSAAKRQINYLIEGAKKYVEGGGRVVSGQYEWSDTGNGYRWKRRK